MGTVDNSKATSLSTATILDSDRSHSGDGINDEKGARDGGSETKLPEDDTVTTTRDAEDSPSSDDEGNYPTGLKLAAIALALCFAVFCVALDSEYPSLLALTEHVVQTNPADTIIATAIPRITDDFHSLDDVGWYSSAYLLCTVCTRSETID